MRKQRRTRITVETDRLLILRQSQSPIKAWCQGCTDQVEMLSADQAATVAGVRCRTLYRWVEAESIHFVEGGDGRLLICFNSLLNWSSDHPRQL
ncbi:MAG: hypothetical protein HY650_02060 [Acidobacteria bacterium]|nr:hypothetical protein [Acidobacteriota bacterium]